MTYIQRKENNFHSEHGIKSERAGSEGGMHRLACTTRAGDALNRQRSVGLDPRAMSGTATWVSVAEILDARPRVRWQPGGNTVVGLQPGDALRVVAHSGP